MQLLTILTPTYNRARLLKNLYKSLCQQTKQDFCWLVVDDGSTDETGQLVREFVARAPFEIRYLYKQNGGKHTAVNLGVTNIRTKLTFIVDSDDQLTNDAVETIFTVHQKYENLANNSGYCFLKGNKDGEILEGCFKKDESIGNYIDDRLNKNMWGDKAEVYFTSVLKQYPFPEYPGEHFISEDIVWIPIALKYNIVQINKQIYICDYLQDGLTQNGRKVKMAAPIGGKERAKQLMNPRCCFKLRMKGALLHAVYSQVAQYSFFEILRDSPMKFVTIIVYPLAAFLKSKWEKQTMQAGRE